MIGTPPTWPVSSKSHLAKREQQNRNNDFFHVQRVSAAKLSTPLGQGNPVSPFSPKDGWDNRPCLALGQAGHCCSSMEGRPCEAAVWNNHKEHEGHEDDRRDRGVERFPPSLAQLLSLWFSSPQNYSSELAGSSLNLTTKKEAGHWARPLKCVLSLVNSPNYFLDLANPAA